MRRGDEAFGEAVFGGLGKNKAHSSLFLFFRFWQHLSKKDSTPDAPEAGAAAPSGRFSLFYVSPPLFSAPLVPTGHDELPLAPCDWIPEEAGRGHPEVDQGGADGSF